MLVASLNECNLSLLLLLQVFVCVSLNTTKFQRKLAPPQTWQISDIIEQAHKDRPIDTMLAMQSRRDRHCNLKDINLKWLPVLQVDESSKIKLKQYYNSEMLALICMSQTKDITLLTTLAANLNRMREARIIIWLHSEASTDTETLRKIGEQADAHNFINLVVLQWVSRDDQAAITAYRLQPFPNSTLQRHSHIADGPIFAGINLNFHGKTAVILPDLLKPRSMLVKDKRTGEQKLDGSSERLIIEFSKKHNIQLRTHRLYRGTRTNIALNILNLTKRGEIDLPIRYIINEAQGNKFDIEFLSAVEIGSLFFVVPCGQGIDIGDVYSGLKTYSTIVFGAYLLFAILETIIVATTYRLFRKCYRPSYFTVIINLRAFCGVLGLPISLDRYRNSLSMQQLVLVMSLFSLIFSCLFNANLSTLLTKQPRSKQIQSFEELRQSGLPVVLSNDIKSHIESHIDAEFFKTILPNKKVVSNLEYFEALMSLNRNYAYAMIYSIWKPIENYQQFHSIKTLCKSNGLIIVTAVPVSGVLPLNSVYKLALNRFIHRTMEIGLNMHWNAEACRKMISFIFSAESTGSLHVSTALSLDDLKWIWMLSGLGYFIAGLVLIVEICIGRWKGLHKRNCIRNV
ncbi:hypothetical protein KR222_009086 [Zaprionus bogoriensis]|nr:hypothetical protein KR222_009086 [Zaprionus bogoriensis]